MPLAKIVKFVVGTLGLVATIFAVVRGFREYRQPVPRLQVAVVNLEHISSRTEIPDVKISLAFKDQSVSDLWLCRVRFQNIGDVTLYTTGAKPNTQNPIVIAVAEKYEILKIEPKGIDPKDSGFDAQITQKRDDKGVPDKRQFEVTFEQWRKGEAIDAVLYLAGSGENAGRPKLIAKGRPILDGDVTAADLSTAAASNLPFRSGFARLVGPSWAGVLRGFSFFTIVVTVSVLLTRRTFPILFSENRLARWVEGQPAFRSILENALILGLYIAMLIIVVG